MQQTQPWQNDRRECTLSAEIAHYRCRTNKECIANPSASPFLVPASASSSASRVIFSPCVPDVLPLNLSTTYHIEPASFRKIHICPSYPSLMRQKRWCPIPHQRTHHYRSVCRSAPRVDQRAAADRGIRSARHHAAKRRRHSRRR